MCGIFGCIRKSHSASTCLDGLHRLEYRGYDSAGLAGHIEGKLVHIREVGKVGTLEKAAAQVKSSGGAFIAHTRWATHGAISERNAHPVRSKDGRFVCVHNGIIENYLTLKHELGTFSTETDTESLVHLAEKHDKGDLTKTVFAVGACLKGRSSFAMIDQKEPGVIVAAALGSSLAVGMGVGVIALASDIHAFGEEIERTFVIPMGHVVRLSSSGFHVYNQLEQQIAVQTKPFHMETMRPDRGDHQHFMLKEILEQPQTLESALADCKSLKELLGELPQHIIFLGCGTSWHAAGVASYWFEKELGIPTQVHIASEFRYGPALIPKNSVVIAISQSGETADTLAAVEVAKEKGAQVIAVCNTTSSALARLSDINLSLRAGPEIGVASTKTYTATLAVMWRLIGGKKENLAYEMQRTLELAPQIEAFAKEWAHFDQMLMIGRGAMLWTARESALKIKELAYIHASAYAAGELKHGPIALIDENCPTLLFCSEEGLASKMITTLMEVRARGGEVWLIAPARLKAHFEELNVPIVFFFSSTELFDSIVASGVLQLFAYYVARERGCSIDQPRNLAKSVTVE